MLERSAVRMAGMVRRHEVSSLELVRHHLEQIDRWQERINAVVEVMAKPALAAARMADERMAAGEECGLLHGVPFTVKDSIDVTGTRSTAGTLGRKNARPGQEDATLVQRLRQAGAIPIAKTNLPDLLFAFETDNFLFGKTNNPYDLTRTPGGSSGGEAALIAACGSPLGLGSDCLGSIRLPAAFCGIAGIKPTSGRLPRTGHVPPFGGWIEKLWQMGPMARWTEDLVLAMRLLAGADGNDFTSPPVPLIEHDNTGVLRIAFFTDNGVAKCAPEIEEAVRKCAEDFAREGARVSEAKPAGIEEAYELELAILGADGMEGLDAYLRQSGSRTLHPVSTGMVERARRCRASASELAERWAQWDAFRFRMQAFFEQYDAVLSPVYTQPALLHRESDRAGNFEGFSYTMAWNVAGFPAATVRCGECGGLPINVQVVAKPWHELTALAVCQMIEGTGGGWKAPAMEKKPVEAASV